MRIENDFRVGAPADAAWTLLNDVPQVVPCMPGAELVEVVGENAWKARLTTKLGAMSFVFDADVTRDSSDAATRTVVLRAKATDQGGRGQATARISSTLEESDEATTGTVATDLTLAGAIARFGRQGLIEDVSAQLVSEFASNLEAKLKAGGAAAGSSPGPAGAASAGSRPDGPESPKTRDRPEGAAPAETEGTPPLRALPLLLRALRSRLKRLFTRSGR